MAVERTVVQDHVVAPAHAIENRARTSHRAHWESCTKGFSKSSAVGLNSVVLLTTAGSITEAGYNFIENEQRAAIMCQLANPLQVAVARWDTSHVRHYRLGDQSG